MSAFNTFAVLSSEEVDCPVFCQKSDVVSGKQKHSKVKKATKKAISVNPLIESIEAFERENPIVAFLFHCEGKDKFVFRVFKFSDAFKLELSAMGLKKIDVYKLEDVINDKLKKPINVKIWLSYFKQSSLKKLADKEYFSAPDELKKTFNLVSGNPITSLKNTNVIIFDFRLKNSMQEFVYHPNGSRIYFGRSFDNFIVDQKRDQLVKLKEHYMRSLKHLNFERIQDAYDEITRLVKNSDAEERIFADEAFCFIKKYVRIQDDDEQVMLRRLLAYNGWSKDLKIKYERARDYKDDLFDLLDNIRKDDERVKMVQNLNDSEFFPSL